MDNIIELKKISFSYDKDYENTLIDDLSLNIERGSFTCILGHNGSGKSTLAKLLNGLYKPASGDIFVDGLSTNNPENELEIRKRVGLVFQNPDNQLVSSVVDEDVAFGPENLGVEREEIEKRVGYALKAVNMSEFKSASPHHLSGGQKQRIAIAGILAMEPECIVLDEPTAMLDPLGRKEIINTIIELNKDKGITIVLITHFMEEAQNADRVIVFDDGRVLFDDTPVNVFSHVDMLKKIGLDVPYTSRLLNSINREITPIDVSKLDVHDVADVLEDRFFGG